MHWRQKSNPSVSKDPVDSTCREMASSLPSWCQQLAQKPLQSWTAHTQAHISPPHGNFWYGNTNKIKPLPPKMQPRHEKPHGCKAGLEQEPHSFRGYNPLNWLNTHLTHAGCSPSGEVLTVPTQQQICPSPKCWAKLEKLMWVKSKPAIYSLNLLLGNP